MLTANSDRYTGQSISFTWEKVVQDIYHKHQHGSCFNNYELSDVAGDLVFKITELMSYLNYLV